MAGDWSWEREGQGARATGTLKTILSDNADFLESYRCKTLVAKVLRDPFLSSEIPWRIPHPPPSMHRGWEPSRLAHQVPPCWEQNPRRSGGCLALQDGWPTTSDVSASLYLLSRLRITQAAAPPGNPGSRPCLNINITSTTPRNENG